MSYQNLKLQEFTTEDLHNVNINSAKIVVEEIDALIITAHRCNNCYLELIKEGLTEFEANYVFENYSKRGFDIVMSKSYGINAEGRHVTIRWA